MKLAPMTIVGLVFAAVSGSSVAVAQTGPTEALDPNSKVCEIVTQLGSRLSKKKICATRAEWADMKRQDREVVDQAQRAVHIGCSLAPTLTNGPIPTC